MDSAVTEFFTLEESPARPFVAAADDTLRDHYGFMVPPDYHELYRVYSPVWEQEETEREAHWSQFLSELAHFHADGGKFSSLEELCENYLQEGVTIALHEQPGSFLHRPKLDALVKGGVPFTIRGSVWTVFLDVAVRKRRNYYNELVKLCLGDLQYRGALELDEIRQQAARAAEALQDAAALHGLPGYRADTEKDLATWRSNSKVWLTQIEKDLPRTFPGLKLMEISGRPALRRVLAAYSLHNSRVGYCQGLNFVVGTLLLFLDEEDAFWCLCALLDDILSGYYDVDMMAMQVDQRVFKRLVSEHFPQLSSYLEGLGADVSCVFVQWFLCVFVNFLPIEACLRVWDALFYYRSPTVLFKTALALVEVFSPALSCCSDVLDALDLLQTMAPLTYDSNRLVDAALGPAFEGVTDMRLATLRREYREEVMAEAAALADELAWESSTSSNGARSATADAGLMVTHGSASSSSQQQQPSAPLQQQPSKMSVLKMIARGMKEKFTGVGGGGGGGGGSGAGAAGSGAGAAAAGPAGPHGTGSGSGANSVERAASPAPPEATATAINAAALAAVAGGVASASASGGGGGGGGGSSRVVAASGGGADEPLLVRAAHQLDGPSLDADSEDYHPLNGDEAFQYEQVGYVAPSDLSESTSNAAVVVVPHPGAGPGTEEERSGGGGGRAAAASGVTSGVTAGATGMAAGTAAPPLPAAAADAVAAASVVDPLAALLEGPVVQDLSAVEVRVYDNDERPIRRNASSSYMWHETPKWTSIRCASTTGTGGNADAPWALRAPAASPMSGGSATVAAAAPGPVGGAIDVGTHGLADAAAAPRVADPRVFVPLSPQALMEAAGRSQSLLQAQVAGLVPPGVGADADGDMDSLMPMRLSFHGIAVSPRGTVIAKGTTTATADAPDVTANAAAPAAAAPPAVGNVAEGHVSAAADPAPAAAVVASAAAGPATAAHTQGSAASATAAAATADFSQVQAADQARRVQGKVGERRCSRAAMMAWEIALEPLRARQQQQQQQLKLALLQAQHQQGPHAGDLRSRDRSRDRGQSPAAPAPPHAQGASALRTGGPPGEPLAQADIGAGAVGVASAPLRGERPHGPLGLGVLQPSPHPPQGLSQTPQPPPQRPQQHPQPHPHSQAPHGQAGGAVPAGLAAQALAGVERSSGSAAVLNGSLARFPAGHPGGLTGPHSAAPTGSGGAAQAAHAALHVGGRSASAPLNTPAGTAHAPPATGGSNSAGSNGVSVHAAGAGTALAPNPGWGSATPPAAIPLAAAGRAAARLAAVNGGMTHVNGGTAVGPHGGAGGGSGHPPLGSSVTSTGSVMLVDEHREASPAEARDEWVIMSAPSGDREGPGAAAVHPLGTAGTYGAPYTVTDSRPDNPGDSTRMVNGTRNGAAAGHPGPATGLAGSAHAAAGGGRGSGPASALPGSRAGSGTADRGHGNGFDSGAQQGHQAEAGLRLGAGMGPSQEDGSGGAGGVLFADPPAVATWQSPGDLGPEAVRNMRDMLGVSDLLLHYSALASRLRAFQEQQAQHLEQQRAEATEPEGADGDPEARSGADAAAAPSPATPGSAAPACVGSRPGGARLSQLPLPLPPIGSGEGMDPSGLSRTLERLAQLQQMLDELAATPATPKLASPSAAAPSAPATATAHAPASSAVPTASSAVPTAGSAVPTASSAVPTAGSAAPAAPESADAAPRGPVPDSTAASEGPADAAGTVPAAPAAAAVSGATFASASAGATSASASTSAAPQPDSLLPLPLPLTLPATGSLPVPPVFSPLGQVVVGPGGQVMLQPPPPLPPPLPQAASLPAADQPKAAAIRPSPSPTSLQSHQPLGQAMPGGVASASPSASVPVTAGAVAAGTAGEADLRFVSSGAAEVGPTVEAAGREPAGQASAQQATDQRLASQLDGQAAAEEGEQAQRERLREAGVLCSAVRTDVDGSRRRFCDAADLLERYVVLSEVLAGRLDELVRQLAEKQYTVDKLSSKLDQTMQKFAAQDNALADKDHAIRHLQNQLQGAATAVGGGLSSAFGLSGLAGLGSSHFHQSHHQVGPGGSNGPNGGGFLRGAQSGFPGHGQGAVGAAGGGGLLAPGGASGVLGGGGAAGAGRPASPQRAGNPGLLWQFGKNLKAKFGSRDESDG